MNSDNDPLRRAYEEVAYPGVADADSHVRALHALARLHGIPAMDSRCCRVLELGCAAGRNLIPQAVDFPGSRFVGTDFSAAQIADGQAIIGQLGLGNIELRHAGFEQVDASWGQFDYILAMGVFSWVTADLQSKLLSICRENLAPHGLALFSYNAYPGWHAQAVVRDLLRYHTAALTDRREQIREARALLELVAASSSKSTVQGRVFHRERDHLRTAHDYYLFHDYLVDENHPIYLHQFLWQAESCGLQFVSDAELWRMSGAFMAPALQNVLANTPLVQRCQLLDFLRNERFHKTLLCHREVALRRDWDVDAVKPFFVALAQKPKAGDIDTSNAEPVGIEMAFGTLTVRKPLGKAAIKHLIDVCPAAVSVDQLHDAAVASLPPEASGNSEIGSGSRTLLAQSLLAALQAGLLKVYVHPPQFCGRVSQRPLATPLARLLATRRSPVISQLHDSVVLDGLQTFLLPQLDGTRDSAALVEAARQAVAAGRLTLPDGNRPVCESVERTLSQLCDVCLLVG